MNPFMHKMTKTEGSVEFLQPCPDAAAADALLEIGNTAAISGVLSLGSRKHFCVPKYCNQSVYCCPVR
jgi:hypothetical protein